MSPTGPISPAAKKPASGIGPRARLTIDGTVADETLSGERTFAGDTAGADGMTIDAAGNLYVTTNVGVRVFAPDGSEWGTLAIPMQPANAAFGGADGRTLYVTARTTLYRVPMPIPGL